MNQLTQFDGQQAKQVSAGANSDAARAMSEIQSAMVIAKRFPRDVKRAIDSIENTFQRVSLAEVSQYQYAKGGTDITGPSIRCAEAIAGLWGNMQFGFRELSRGIDDDGVGFSDIEAYAHDLESNTKTPRIFIVRHWIDKRGGGRKTSDEREIYELSANMAQRRVRACIMSVIPGDVFDVAMAQAALTLNTNADVSAEGIAKLLATFSKEFSVTQEQIETRIQRRMDAIQPAQIVSLKRIYVSLRDGMSTPEQWFDGGTGLPEDTETRRDFSQDEFASSLPQWTGLIKSGTKSPDDIIAFVESTHIMSAAQKLQLRDIDGQAKQEDQTPIESGPEAEEPVDQKMSDEVKKWLQDYES